MFSLTQMDDDWRNAHPKDAAVLTQIGLLLNSAASVEDSRRLLILVAQHLAAHGIYPTFTFWALVVINDKHCPVELNIEEIFDVVRLVYGDDDPGVKIPSDNRRCTEMRESADVVFFNHRKSAPFFHLKTSRHAVFP